MISGNGFIETHLITNITVSPHYQNVQKIHAEFHENAAIVGQLAISSDKVEADKLMAFHGGINKFDGGNQGLALSSVTRIRNYKKDIKISRSIDADDFRCIITVRKYL